MTRDEAINELAEIDPKEVEAWQKYEARTKRRDQEYADLKTRLDKVHPEAADDLRRLDAEWSPMYRRKIQLKIFIEMTT